MTRALAKVADSWADGRILSFLEGGCELGALGRSARAHVEELAGLNDLEVGGGLSVN
jgi:acetoin utilization deacetylase AcuC-like enzyme